MSDPKEIYLGPACEADSGSYGDGRTWAEDQPWDDCAGTAGYLDPRCTCGFSNAVRAAGSASVCSTCNGSGEARGRTYHLGPDDHEIDVECPACFGLGEIKLSPGFKPRERTCHFCNGSGKASSASEEQA